MAGKPVGLQPDQTPMAGIVGTEMEARARVERYELTGFHPGTAENRRRRVADREEYQNSVYRRSNEGDAGQMLVYRRDADFV